jgi:esterase FrsA
MKKIISVFAVVLTCLYLPSVFAQVQERTIDEIKQESILRAEKGAYPLGGLNPQDVTEALSYIKTRDRDDWAAGFSKVAEKYMEIGKQSSDLKASGEAYKKAWRLYYFAQWPVPNSQGKKLAYENALDAYAKYSKTLDNPMQAVEIPFEGKVIHAYVRMPQNASGPVPMILAISGLDSRKETVAESYAQILDKGVGYLAVDSPGTGQAPVKVGPSAGRMFSAILDYMAQQAAMDKTRIVVSGVSFGGYWAADLAFREKARILGAVAQSPPVDEFFQTQFLYKNTLGNREYLFDLAPAFINVFDGASNVNDLAKLMPRMSLKAQGLLNQPSSPMLVVTGAKDTQVPISDIELLMRSGDAPKDAWINPQGGHLGRQLKGWTDPVIFTEVIVPWELRLIEASKKQ